MSPITQKELAIYEDASKSRSNQQIKANQGVRELETEQYRAM